MTLPKWGIVQQKNRDFGKGKDNMSKRFHELANVLRSFEDLELMAAEVEALDGLEEGDKPNSIEELTEVLEEERETLRYW